MISHHHYLLPILSSLALTIPVVAQAQPPAGRLLAAQCAQCHGTDGKAVGDMENLAGNNAQELFNEMLEMKYSTNMGDIMHRQAKGYDESQLSLIAQYYASLRSGTANRGTNNGAAGTGNNDD
ncbi:MAG: cytochrome C [Candidatus Competibacteraceae bacterium]